MCTSRRVRGFASLLLCLLLLAASREGLVAWRARLLPQPSVVTRTDVALQFLGAVRTAVAKVLWLKVDVYHHQMEDQGIPWNQERDLLPLYRAVTTLDPHFEEAYDVGAHDLVMGGHQVDAGLAFLQEGLAANPGSRNLHFRAAFLLHHLHRPAEALPHAKEALGRSQEGMDVLNSARLVAHAARECGQASVELEALRMGHRLKPDDPYISTRLRALEAP